MSAPPSDVRTCRSKFVTNLLLPITTTFFLVAQEVRPLEPEPVVHPSRPRASRVRCNQGTFVKFQPQSVDFLEISNPRAVLETTMRHFSCLTEGDVICLPYNDRVQQPYFRATRVCRVLCFFGSTVAIACCSLVLVTSSVLRRDRVYDAATRWLSLIVSCAAPSPSTAVNGALFAMCH